MDRKTRLSVPLQLMITAAIIVSMSAMAATLLYQGYRGMADSMIAVANQSTRQLVTTINERITALTSPAITALQILQHDPIMQAQTPEQRWQRVPALASTLVTHDMLSAIYVGYEDGDFFMLRLLKPDDQREFFAAPDDAYFMVQSIHQGKGEWHYLNQALEQVLHQPRPDYRFDPRTRIWFERALLNDAPVLTPPYVFFTTQEVGITLARRAAQGGAVIGMDATVSSLSTQMEGLRLTPSTEIALLDEYNTVIAWSDLESLLIHEAGGTRLAQLHELNIPALHHLDAEMVTIDELIDFETWGHRWFGVESHISALGANRLRILIAIPARELLSDVITVLMYQARWALLVLVLLLCGGWYLGARIGKPLRALTDQVGAYTRFDFTQPIDTHSGIREVHQLSAVLREMSNTLQHFQAMSLSMNRESELDSMLRQVLEHLTQAVGSQHAAIYLYQPQTAALQLQTSLGEDTYVDSISTAQLPDAADDQAIETLLRNADSQPALIMVLRNRRRELLGVLRMSADDSDRHLRLQEIAKFIADISSSAAVAIETRQLIQDQQALIDGIIRLVADAIDAKSPYTSGHCERVPQLALMLVEAAERSQLPTFEQFNMSEEERYAFRIAAWLHDCGKITSPEYVVDKATKLETIYNRIHEIRTRFEVLHRDLEIAALKAQLGGADAEQALANCRDQQARLQEEFAFVARMNMGAESTQPQDLERLQQISEQRWTRHFSAHLGLSSEEAARMPDPSSETLPASEQLLSDRPEHCIPWQRRPPVEKNDPRNQWGFDMKLPLHAYNFGELYNLSIPYGTLTEEERFKINEHIVQTIIMLDALPLPAYLRRVPTIAGNHHERMDGAGYPRQLQGAEMSIEDRIMAVADVFEALTAADRPYKQAKSLSESLSIMVNMVERGHIDAATLELFIDSRVYCQYARHFLQPEQIDAVDEAALLSQLRTLG